MRTVRWTARAARRLEDAVVYIARNFYPEYARAFRDDVLETVAEVCRNPGLGTEAFPDLGRPDVRRILCRNRRWYVYYRVRDGVCEVLSVRHTLQATVSPKGL